MVLGRALLVHFEPVIKNISSRYGVGSPDDSGYRYVSMNVDSKVRGGSCHDRRKVTGSQPLGRTGAVGAMSGV